jgi:hypothetical protein
MPPVDREGSGQKPSDTQVLGYEEQGTPAVRLADRKERKRWQNIVAFIFLDGTAKTNETCTKPEDATPLGHR